MTHCSSGPTSKTHQSVEQRQNRGVKHVTEKRPHNSTPEIFKSSRAHRENDEIGEINVPNTGAHLLLSSHAKVHHSHGRGKILPSASPSNHLACCRTTLLRRTHMLQYSIPSLTSNISEHLLAITFTHTTHGRRIHDRIDKHI